MSRLSQLPEFNPRTQHRWELSITIKMTNKKYPLEERCLIAPVTQERPKESLPRQTEAVPVAQSGTEWGWLFHEFYTFVRLHQSLWNFNNEQGSPTKRHKATAEETYESRWMDGWMAKEEFTYTNILILIHPTFTLYTVQVYHLWLINCGVCGRKTKEKNETWNSIFYSTNRFKKKRNEMQPLGSATMFLAPPLSKPTFFLLS